MTTPLTLVIANKNYSSWSSRPWLVMTELGIAFGERMLKFDSEDWATHIAALSPSRLVPVLWEGKPGEGFPTFDTLAIIERLHELFPDKGVWPSDARARARARSLVADFHAGYRAMRAAMPMNLRGHYPGKGMSPEVAQDIEGLTARWVDTRREFGEAGRFLFGDYCAADAFFAPVASRFLTYGVGLEGEARNYQQTLLETASFAAWRKAALQETEFVAADEPYAAPR
jgi:glutathione S-transferase